MTTNSQSNKTSAWLLIAGVVALAVFGLVVGNILVPGSEFGGADGQAEEVIASIDPNVKPWFSPIWEPPGGETESMLFALQAALGAGFVGYVLGLKRGQNKTK
ncbi:MAG: energy-coupling factor ABC transporter substrate-binding protein [Chloroflexi bacterium]|nr:energy-coupling factor ABC transporter substrate-binding protein [Chloroflexota bacterium]